MSLIYKTLKYTPCIQCTLSDCTFSVLSFFMSQVVLLPIGSGYGSFNVFLKSPSNLAYSTCLTK